MPIQVVCPGCKTRFNVSEKFAGREGPCPKCKKTIKIPEAQQDIVIHAPAEHAQGGVSAKGRPITKPIEWQEPKFAPVPMMISAAAAVVVVVIAALTREQASTLLRAIGLVIVSPPIVAAGYGILRDDELEPFRGRSLWLRSLVCGLVFAALWAAFWLYMVPNGLTTEAWHWALLAPVLLIVGASAGFASFEFDFANGLVLYGFYLLVTSLLGYANGLPMPWNATV